MKNDELRTNIRSEITLNTDVNTVNKWFGRTVFKVHSLSSVREFGFSFFSTWNKLAYV